MVMKKLLYTFLFVLLLASCATKTRIEYVDREVVKYEKQYVHDTTLVEKHDSVFHTIIQRGDTVYDIKYYERTKYRDRIVVKVDTCFKDSIHYEYKEAVKKVVKYPKSYWYLLGFSILFIIFAIYKIIRWLQIL